MIIRTVKIVGKIGLKLCGKLCENEYVVCCGKCGKIWDV